MDSRDSQGAESKAISPKVLRWEAKRSSIVPHVVIEIRPGERCPKEFFLRVAFADGFPASIVDAAVLEQRGGVGWLKVALSLHDR